MLLLWSHFNLNNLIYSLTSHVKHIPLRALTLLRKTSYVMTYARVKIPRRWSRSINRGVASRHGSTQSLRLTWSYLGGDFDLFLPI